MAAVTFLPAAASACLGLGRQPLLLSGSSDWTARLWDAETGHCRCTCVGHGGPLTALQVAAHGGGDASGSTARLLTGAADGTLAVWGLDGELHSLAQAHDAPLMLLKQGSDTLVSGGRACCVLGACLRLIAPACWGSSHPPHTCHARAAGSADNACHVWSLPHLTGGNAASTISSRQLLQLPANAAASRVSSSAASSWTASEGSSSHCTGTTDSGLGSGGVPGDVSWAPLHPRSPLLASHRRTAFVGAMAFDPVTELLCSGDSNGIVSVWNCSTAQQRP